MLDQHGLRAVFEDDVVLRIAALELEGDFVVGIELRVPFGYWEAKDSKDVQAVELSKLLVDQDLAHRLRVFFLREGTPLRAAASSSTALRIPRSETATRLRPAKRSPNPAFGLVMRKGFAAVIGEHSVAGR